MKKIILFVAILFTIALQAQENKGYRYFEPTLLSGWIMPIHTGFPDARLQSSGMLGMGKLQTDTAKAWVPFYNFPHTGFSLIYSDYGNPQKLGHSFSFVPYMVINTGRKTYGTSNIKIGLGGSYFNEYFDKETNDHNWAISTPLNWTFLLNYYYNLKISDKTLWTIGAGVMHSSNAHTSIPNFGLNTFFVNTSFQFYTKSLETKVYEGVRPKPAKSREYYLSVHLGDGWHKLADANWPRESPTKRIYSLSVYGSKVYNHSFRLKAGASYRFYESYYDYIRDEEIDPFDEDPAASASNVFVSVGGELLLGHVGAEGEIGVNLFKPFYDEFNNRFENGNKGLGHTLKMYFPTRLGIKLYALNANEVHKHNFFVATHINANMGAADFWGISTGYIHKL